MVVERKCTVWKSGIHWQTTDGVEALVEVVNQNKSVVALVGSLPGKEMACVHLRSKLIQEILKVKKEYTQVIDTTEYFILPSDIAKYANGACTLRDISKVSIAELALAIAERKDVVTLKEGFKNTMVATDTLLHFEPFIFMNNKAIAKLFDRESRDRVVSNAFIKTLEDDFQERVTHLETVLCSPNDTNTVFSGSQIDTIVQSSGIQTKRGHCHEVFMNWMRNTPVKRRTYKGLRNLFNKYSVFCGRNPLVRCIYVWITQNLLNYNYYNYAGIDSECK